MMRNDQGRSFYYGPNGEQRIFEQGEEVPSGWRDHPFEQKAKGTFDHDGNGQPGGSKPSDEPTAPEIIDSIDGRTNLDKLEEAENAREKPRVTVLRAIEDERARRAE